MSELKGKRVSREVTELRRAREAVDRLVHRAFKQVLRRRRRVVRVPPGYGKTRGAVSALASVRGEGLRVLWFTPEVRAQSVAHGVEADLRSNGIDNVQLLYRLSEQLPADQDRLINWQGPELQVKILAHAYLPLLFHGSVSRRLSPLRDADLVIIDENPFGSLLSTCGFEPDPSKSGHLTQLPLLDVLLDLQDAGGLRIRAEDVHEALLTALERQGQEPPPLRDGRHQEVPLLGGEELSRVMQPFLTPQCQALRGTAFRGGRNERSWKEAAERSTAPDDGEDTGRQPAREAGIRRQLLYLVRNIRRLAVGDTPHGLAIVKVAGQGEVFVHSAYFQRPNFGRRGVLHLDAFAHELVTRQWLPRAETLLIRPTKRRPVRRALVTVLRTPHEHDTLSVQRRAVAKGESLARHQAVVARGLQCLGDRVLVLAHAGFGRTFGTQLDSLRKSHAQQVKFRYWNASLGVNEFQGYDALVLNDSRLPRIVAALDYAALSCTDVEKNQIKQHLERADFLQLLHRVRPLIQRARGKQANTILATFDPLEAYTPLPVDENDRVAQGLIEASVDVVFQDIPALRSKSEHVLFLELARLTMDEALKAWGFIPFRLLLLLAGDSEEVRRERWDPELQAFIAHLASSHPLFEQLEATSKPSDPQFRGLLKLREDANRCGLEQADPRKLPYGQEPKACRPRLVERTLKGMNVTVPGRRGRRPRVVVWVPEDEAAAEQAGHALAKVKAWHRRYRRKQAQQPVRQGADSHSSTSVRLPEG